ncbi:hypothetical protein ACLB2K_068539 [Fragaria x ananassa]
MMTYAAPASRPLCFNTQPSVALHNGLLSAATSTSSTIGCSRSSRKVVGSIKASSSPTRPTLSTNWDFQFPSATAPSPTRVPRFEELDTTNMLLRQRIIFLGSQVDDMTADLIISQLLFLDAENPQKDITLFINSPGGSVTAGMGIYDAMKMCKADVSTVCFGLAASMGAFLLASGSKGKRYCMPNARVMIHQPLGTAGGKATEMGIRIREMAYHKIKLNKILSRITGKPFEQVEEDTDRDNFMNPWEAKDYGLIDDVIDDGKPGLVAPIGDSTPPPRTKVWDMWKVEGTKKSRKNLPSEQKNLEKDPQYVIRTGVSLRNDVASFTMTATPPPVSPSRTTCASLLHELQIIWDEIGESDRERDTMLLQLEQECLDIYRKKVEMTRKYRAELHRSLADGQAQIAAIASALGEATSFSRARGTLRDQISAVKPVLEELSLKKQERVNDFSVIQTQIARISSEIAGNGVAENAGEYAGVDETDLTLKRLGELKSHLEELHKEKALRLQKVNSQVNIIHDLSVVMSIDFFEMLNEVHPSLTDQSATHSKSISNDTLARLTALTSSLKQEKQQRLHKLQELGSKLIEVWNLMETPTEERNKFDHVTRLITSSVDGLSRHGCLSLDVIEQTEAEVQWLNVLKASKMKELVFKRQNELEEIYRGVHMDVDSDGARQILTSLIDSGNVDLSDLLSSMDDQIVKAKEQALSRKDILDKLEKCKFAFEEDKWLDEYEKDENRYSAGRGAHKNLKRAEKARILVGKIPSIIENLIARVKAWESEKGVPFLYDKVRLLHIVEEYSAQRQEREEEKRKSREQKRLQEQHATEQEALFGSRPSTKKPLGQSTNANTNFGTPISRRTGTPLGRHGVSAGKERRESGRANMTPVNYVALPKDDSISRRN